MKSFKNQTFILLDVSNLAWRSFHVMGHLSFKGIQTGILFGLLKDIQSLQTLFDTRRVIFCFDRGRSLRAREYSNYKKKRQQADFDEVKLAAIQEVRRQLHLMRREYFKELGYVNIFSQFGYEADDIIAAVASHIATKQGEAIVVGSDHDLYQCLSPRVRLYDPRIKKIRTEKWFREEHGISPIQWIDVKSIAGCSSDEIAGIKGVGEKTALKFLRGQLKADSAAYKAIVAGNAIWQRNRSLVELPYPGVKEFEIKEDDVTDKKWQKLAKRLGMKSIMGKQAIEPDKDYRRRLVKRKGFF